MSKVIGQYTYSVDEWLGNGSFATVYKGYNISTNEAVAIKVISFSRLERLPNGPKVYRNLLSEISTMKTLKHPNIVQLHDVVNSDQSLSLILDYCNGGDLSSYMRKQPNMVLTEKKAHHIAVQIARGLEHMYGYNMVHRDLKPQNILINVGTVTEVSEGSEVAIKIADFGFAKVMDSKLAETICGSPLYMAPEVLDNKKYTNLADLWSYGVILYELLVGNTPFQAKNIFDLTEYHRKNERVILPFNTFVSNECRHLLAALLIINPEKRISWADFLSHPWLRREKITEQINIPCPCMEHGIGSAPISSSQPHVSIRRLALTGSQMPTNNLLRSFIIVNKDPDIQRINDWLCIEKMNEPCLRKKLNYWVKVINTLIDLNTTLAYKHCLNVISIVEKVVLMYLKERKGFDIIGVNDLTRDDLFDDCETLLPIVQFNKLREEANQNLKSTNASSSTVSGKTIEKYIYDMSLSYRKRGDVEIEIENPEQADNYYRISIYLLESLVPFAQEELKQELYGLMDRIKQNVGDYSPP